MQLPFLKKTKWPRIAKPMEEKSYGGDASDKIEEHCAGELMEAVASKDVSGFRSALEALVVNMFETEGSPDGA